MRPMRTAKPCVAVKMGNALDAGLQLAKDLGNEPPNICNPNYLLAQARKLGRAGNVKGVPT
ncbi:MAG: hypothetical protein CM15mP120_27560 [Pseudomonadota bacterium]|nr:MAG: hypothetical protein CM15mP120_27560 [Pseudomonadota bacterium]